MIEKGSSVDFGYKSVLCKSKVDPQLVKDVFHFYQVTPTIFKITFSLVFH